MGTLETEFALSVQGEQVAELMSKNIPDSTCANADAAASECACRETWSEGERERMAWEIGHGFCSSRCAAFLEGGLRDSPDNDFFWLTSFHNVVSRASRHLRQRGPARDHP